MSILQTIFPSLRYCTACKTNVGTDDGACVHCGSRDLGDFDRASNTRLQNARAPFVAPGSVGTSCYVRVRSIAPLGDEGPADGGAS